MTTITLTFDPDDAAEVARARALLDRLTPDRSGHDPEVVRQKVIALLRGYGAKRTEYIRQVARAAPGTTDHADLVAIIGSHRAVDETYSAVERAWREKNMPGPFITIDALGSARMDQDLADIVLTVLHDVIDEPDPLRAAVF